MIKIVICALIAPELMIYWAIRQRMGTIPHEIRVDVDYCECAREFVVVQPTKLIVVVS